MKGKPKYKVGTTVKFIVGDELKTGNIFVVDAYGTFDNPTDVSYDIRFGLINKEYLKQ